jgi:hypothetical protein
MRTFVLLPIAAAALATTAAIGAWSLGPAGSRVGVSDRERAPTAISQNAASGTIGAPARRPTPIAFPRYRAEACSGDYVCREDGAWEPVAGASAETWTLTSDGF